MPPDSPSSEKENVQFRRVIAAIPVRYASSRLPGKALLPVAGIPMVERVYRRVELARGLSRVVVLTDDDRIAEAVRAFGGEVEMTPGACESGTDRIAWAARNWDSAAVLNVQGDEPLIDPRALERLAEHLVVNSSDAVATLASIAKPEDVDNPNVVKVVTDQRNYALYFSRSTIPYPRNPGVAKIKRHIGVYGYQRSSLLDIAACRPTELERAESLEQLRMLENGFRIRVLMTEHAWPGVDTMDDLEKLNELLSRNPELAEI